MHYSVELWTNYNKVYHQFNAHIQGLNDLILMFNERYKSKQNLAEILKKLSESKKKPYKEHYEEEKKKYDKIMDELDNKSDDSEDEEEEDTKENQNQENMKE